MRSNLFDHIDIDLKNTNIENGKATDRQAECDRYNKLLVEMADVEKDKRQANLNDNSLVFE